MKIRHRETILWVEAFGFGALVVSSWITEVMHLPHVLFDEVPEFNWERGLLRTAVVCCVWIVVHLSTRRLLQRLHHLEEYLRICAWCRKIGHHDEWMTTEEYFGSAFSTKTTHGVCPACSAVLKQPTVVKPTPVATSVRTP